MVCRRSSLYFMIMDPDTLQGRAKKTRKFAAVKRLLSPNDARLYANYSLALPCEAFNYTLTGRRTN